MEIRRETLKIILEMILRVRDVENFPKYKEYYKEHGGQPLEPFGEMTEILPKPPDGYYEWVKAGMLEKLRDESGLVEFGLKFGKKPTLEDAMIPIIAFGYSLSKNNIERLFSGLAHQTESPVLRGNHDICELMNSTDKELQEVISMLGEAYGRLGISVDKLPEICIQDTSFLKGYFLNFPVDEKNIPKERSPEYMKYMKLVIICESVEKDALIERGQKIKEAVALVDMKQGPAQE